MLEPVTITSTAVTTGWPVVCGVGVTSCAATARTEGRTPAMIARPKQVLARFFMAAHACSAAREFCAKSCNNRMAAIIAEYLIIFKPLVESFSAGRGARLCRGSAQSRDATEVLEALRQCHKPGSPSDVGRPLVVAVFESAEIVKHARIPAVSRERAKSWSTEYVGTINFAFRRVRLSYIPSQVVAIDGERECSKATAAEYRGIQLIGSLVIETFGDDSLHVL